MADGTQWQTCEPGLATCVASFHVLCTRLRRASGSCLGSATLAMDSGEQWHIVMTAQHCTDARSPCVENQRAVIHASKKTLGSRSKSSATAVRRRTAAVRPCSLLDPGPSERGGSCSRSLALGLDDVAKASTASRWELSGSAARATGTRRALRGPHRLLSKLLASILLASCSYTAGLSIFC